MSTQIVRISRARTSSAYTRGDAEVSRLRSGIAVVCDYCGAKPGERCTNQRDTSKPILYNHPERRKAGRLLADAVVAARRKPPK
jgi:hypothetical protein